MHICRQVVLAGALALGTASVLPSQSTYGAGTPGTGGVVPRISCNQPWTGRTDFAVQISDARGGSFGLLYVSQSQAAISLGGLTLYVDPAVLLFSQFFSLGGQAGVAGDGAASLPIPLTTTSAQLIGLELYGQAAVFDPAGPGFGGNWTATSGVACELTAVPQLFAATSVAGSTDPAWGIQGINRSLDFSIGNAATNNVNGVAYTRDGNTVFVASSFGGIQRGDLSGGGAPVWSVLNAAISGGGAIDILVMDDARDLLWCIDRSTGVREVAAIDVAPGSPTFGTIVHSTLNLENSAGVIGGLSMDADRNRAAVLDVFGSTLTILDTDPGSPSFLQTTTSTAVPAGVASGGLAFNNSSGFSPDGSRCYVLRQVAGTNPSELAVLDIENGTWLDFNPSTPALDHVGPTSLPPVTWGSALVSLDVGPEGGIYVGGFGGSGTAGRLDIQGITATWTPATLTTSVAQTWSVAVNRDGTTLAVGVGNNGASLATRVVFFDAATMVEIDSVTLGSGAAIYTLAWR